MSNRPLLFIFGTRSETIKCLPVIRAIQQRHPHVPLRVGATGQHSLLFTQIAEIENLRPSWNLEVMAGRQMIHDLVGRIISELESPIRHDEPRLIVACGDSASTFGSTVCSHLSRHPLLHLEAGIRGTVPGMPFPEEGFRRMISSVAQWHGCFTQEAKQNLLAEGVAENRMLVAEDPAMDAFAAAVAADDDVSDPEFEPIDWSKPLALSTVVRRENHGDGGFNICNAYKELAQRNPDLQIVHVNHLNPHLSETFWNVLRGHRGITVTAPLPRKPFIHLLRRCRLVISDSVGVLQEAASLGLPILSLRGTPDRGQSMRREMIFSEAGNSTDRIVQGVEQAMRNTATPSSPAVIQHPFTPGAPAFADWIVSCYNECP